MKKRISFLFGIALIIGVATIVLAAVTWKTVAWTSSYYGSIALNIDGDMEVTISTCFPTSCWGTAHYNTPGYFRAAATPWVKVTFLDSGPGTPGLQIWMEDEEYVYPTAGAWTQFGAWQREGFDNYQIYWWDFDTDLADDNDLNDSNNSWGWVDTGIERTAGMHTLKLAMRNDGTVDYWFDGVLVHSSTDITPNYFGDIYLAGHSDPSNPNETVIFTDYETGIYYTPLGMISYWKYDENFGTTAFDSADANDGALVNGPVWTTGQVGGALSFDGFNDHVEVPDSDSLDITGDLTLEAWIEPDSVIYTAQGEIIGKWVAGNASYYFAIRDGYLQMRISANGSDYYNIEETSNANLSIDTWYHVVGVYDASEQDIKLYINGVVEESTTVEGIIPSIIHSGSAKVKIGGFSPGYYFDGKIDEVAIYDRVLTACEICQHYNNGLVGKGYTLDTLKDTIETLIINIEHLGLSKGIENSLTAKLDNALDSLEKGRDNAAKNKLEAFINEVEAQRGKKLTDEQADALIIAAQCIIDNI